MEKMEPSGLLQGQRGVALGRLGPLDGALSVQVCQFGVGPLVRSPPARQDFTLNFIRSRRRRGR